MTRSQTYDKSLYLQVVKGRTTSTFKLLKLETVQCAILKVFSRRVQSKYESFGNIEDNYLKPKYNVTGYVKHVLSISYHAGCVCIRLGNTVFSLRNSRHQTKVRIHTIISLIN